MKRSPVIDSMRSGIKQNAMALFYLEGLNALPMTAGNAKTCVARCLKYQRRGT